MPHPVGLRRGAREQQRGTESMAPRIIVNISRDSPGSDDFHASAAAISHCAAKTPRNVR